MGGAKIETERSRNGSDRGLELRESLRAHGLRLGFDKVGFARAKLPHESGRLEDWLASGFAGEMRWMTRGPERRTDATRSLAGAATVVCCALNYYQGAPRRARGPLGGVISTYAQGEDYHRVLSEKLEALNDVVRGTCGVEGKVYVDTGPLLEKAYAVAAGLGWLGKHSNLLSRNGSSWFFLGEILLPLALPPDAPEGNHCGTCTRCITACPTGAIVRPYVVDSRLCISYLTIELRGPIPRPLRPLIGARIYGCDDCQDVCPWNRFARQSEESRFFPREPLSSLDLIGLLRLTRSQFDAATRGSAIRRARYSGFLRNVAVALGNSGDRRAVAPLLAALEHLEPLVRGHAAWALSELGASEALGRLEARRSAENLPEVREELDWALSRLAESKRALSGDSQAAG
jgi:epoxyqueuosine reductase